MNVYPIDAVRERRFDVYGLPTVKAVPTDAELDRLAGMLGLPPLPPSLAHPADEQCRCVPVGPRPAHQPTGSCCRLVAL